MKVPVDMPKLESKCVSEEDKWWALVNMALKFVFHKMQGIPCLVGR
jgi:hypothetical protein